MLHRLGSGDNPNLFLLIYRPHVWMVEDFLVIPKQFFTPNLIEKRKSLAPTARRAGWVGCNILVKNIPESGKVFFVKNAEILAKKTVRQNWEKLIFLREAELQKEKTWVLSIMKCIEEIKKDEFGLNDLYQYSGRLQKIFPNNNNVNAKIRQQLQILRDNGYIVFLGQGRYRLVK